MEIIINDIGAIDRVIIFLIPISIILLLISISIKKDTNLKSGIESFVILSILIIFVAGVTFATFSRGIMNDIDCMFDNIVIEVIQLDDVIVSANTTRIQSDRFKRDFFINTSREQESILINYFEGHICEIEYTQNGRIITKIKVIE